MWIEIESLKAFDSQIEQAGNLEQCVIQGLDLTERTNVLLRISLADAVFLGCHLAQEVVDYVYCSGCRTTEAPVIFPRFPELPHAVYRNALYSPDELLGAYRPGCPETYANTLDDQIYRRFDAFRQSGQSAPVLETLARRIHDHSIDDALEELLRDGDAPRRVIAIMGGHSLARSSPQYATVARISRDLTRRRFFLASGGGPGAMEATNLGAWFAPRPDDELDQAIAILSRAPGYDPKEAWLDAAFDVRSQFPLREVDGVSPWSLGIPTWLYGHEPPNVFASHIAKYFANSIREEGLLAIATYGVIFAPGSAGTIQEIFMDACQNHYKSFGSASPMVFLDRTYWTETKPVYPLVQQLAVGQEYERLLIISDDADEIARRLDAFAGSPPPPHP